MRSIIRVGVIVVIVTLRIFTTNTEPPPKTGKPVLTSPQGGGENLAPPLAEDRFLGPNVPMSQKKIDSPQPKYSPDFSFEQQLLDRGVINICGIDEAGRGPLAGPVVASAVILDAQAIPDGLHDSKKLTEKKREVLFDAILETSWVSIANVSAKTIDRMNIRAASLYAMTMAAKALEHAPGHALIDGNALPDGMPCPATEIIKGDARSLSIAAASIIAKVSRDRLMVKMENHYPGYGFAKHKGYPTQVHRDAVMELGPCPIHRLTFGPVKAAMG